jgi:hypothetical protein
MGFPSTIFSVEYVALLAIYKTYKSLKYLNIFLEKLISLSENEDLRKPDFS